MALTDEIEEPPGRCHDDVGSRAEMPNLAALAHAAKDRGVSQCDVPAVRTEALADLRRQLTCRTQHEGPRASRPLTAPGPSMAVRSRQQMENGQCERAGLPGTRLGAANHVSPASDGGIA
jgi:hypothetical protein